MGTVCSGMAAKVFVAGVADNDKPSRRRCKRRRATFARRRRQFTWQLKLKVALCPAAKTPSTMPVEPVRSPTVKLPAGTPSPLMVTALPAGQVMPAPGASSPPRRSPPWRRRW
ncbi:hypothetical protein [Lysobacter gummosus]